jgi:hypothetical protein
MKISKQKNDDNPDYLGYDEDNNGDWDDFFRCNNPECDGFYYITTSSSICPICGDHIEWLD